MKTCARLYDALALAVIGVVALSIACSGIEEPGTPVHDSTPLFGQYSSYRTLEDLKSKLPQRAQWRVLTDSAAGPRNGCPPLRELSFIIPASDLGQRGELTLTFINDRLESTIFTPTDFSSYLSALKQRGIVFATNELTVAPATVIWRSTDSRQPGFVGWRDSRFQSQVDMWTKKCS
jgi:hypothetical protein